MPAGHADGRALGAGPQLCGHAGREQRGGPRSQKVAQEGGRTGRVSGVGTMLQTVVCGCCCCCVLGGTLSLCSMVLVVSWGLCTRCVLAGPCPAPTTCAVWLTCWSWLQDGGWVRIWLCLLPRVRCGTAERPLPAGGLLLWSSFCCLPRRHLCGAPVLRQPAEHFCWRQLDFSEPQSASACT